MAILTDREDHILDHSRTPRADCQFCREAHEARLALYAGSTLCSASGRIFGGQYERTNGSGAWARGTCPTCSRRVGITRPTKRHPWPLVGTHKA